MTDSSVPTLAEGSVADSRGRSSWRRARAAVVLTAVVTVGLVFALFDGTDRPWILGPAILVLDGAGAVYSWRAGRHSLTGVLPWRLVAAGRAASIGTTVCLSASVLGGATAWWWAGTLMRLLMYLFLAAGVLVSGLRQTAGRPRTALLAEIATVLAAGFMVIWYFALEPVFEHQGPSVTWFATIGWSVGDLLLLASVASVILRGAATRFGTTGTTFFAGGLALYLAADVIRSAIGPSGPLAETDLAALGTIVAASLLMTVAPMLTVAGVGRPHEKRTTRPPAWAVQLPMVGMFAGSLLVLAVVIHRGRFLHWGGLVSGLIVMSCAAALQQLVSLRESRDRIISDPLTGLANRGGLDEALDRAVKHEEPVAVLLLDLDGFKLVNDAYGHAVGDTFLTRFAEVLRSTTRRENVCARIGGDEFAILVTDVARIEQAVAVAERILAVTAAHPVSIEGDTVPIRASIGIALAQPGYNGKTLLRQADVAMYQSKRDGNHSYTCYDPSMIDRRTVDAALSDDLEHALPRGEFHLLYQPLVDLADGRPIAAEALLRWQHPTRGLVSPVEFIPVAERSGVINGIGLWVLEQALRRLETLPAAMHMSVNLSPRQLLEPTIVHDILAIMNRVGTDPRRLVLEVTESALVDENSGIAALRVLREHGIRIAIDDFGTGYSSLQYLTRLPVDILKVDRSFVGELNGTPEGSAVTDAVIRLAHVLHLTTVAEGIETESQAAELRALGCGVGQGYLFAKPLTPEALARFATTGVPAGPAIDSRSL